MTGVECLRVSFGIVGGGIFNLGGDFTVVVMKVEVGDFELVVKTFARLV